MNSVFLSAALLVGADDAAPKPLVGNPTAIVIYVKGAVVAKGRLKPRRVEPGEELLPGEVLSAPADGEALLIFLTPRERRRLKPGTRTTLTRDGGEPADALERLGPAKLSHKNLNRVREVEVREGGGVGVGRGEKSPTEARVTPLYGTFIATQRPAFTWPPVDRAESYLVELKDGDSRRWKVETKEAKLNYPAKEKPLEFGQKYLWTVKAKLPDGDEKTVVDESHFILLFPGEPEALAPVRELAESDNPEDLLLAAAAYEAYGVLDQTLAVFEKLTRLQPGVARYWEALERSYRHAGRPDEAQEASQKAKALRSRARG